MLHRSGDNLLEGAISFVNNNSEIILFSAYLKLDTLKKLNNSGHIKQIIVRWEVQDLCVGASDIELYHYCLNNKISLFRNTRLHMKAIWNNIVIAESDATEIVEGNHYFPLDSIKPEFFTKTELTTVCGWKGKANSNNKTLVYCM